MGEIHSQTISTDRPSRHLLKLHWDCVIFSTRSAKDKIYRPMNFFISFNWQTPLSFYRFFLLKFSKYTGIQLAYNSKEGIYITKWGVNGRYNRILPCLHTDKILNSFSWNSLLYQNASIIWQALNEESVCATCLWNYIVLILFTCMHVKWHSNQPPDPRAGVSHVRNLKNDVSFTQGKNDFFLNFISNI